jgi:preprotein translocase subunit SecE
MNREDKRARRRDESRAERAERAVPAGALPSETYKRERTPPGQFLREVRAELRKVAWPSRREVAVYTVTVLAVTTVLTVLIFGMDFVIREAALRFF